MMANKILGQAAPLANNSATLYTVPAGKEANINIFCCNTSTVTEEIRIAIIKSGDSLDTKSYIAYGIPVTTMFNITGFCLSEGDTIYIFVKNGTAGFTATGLEYNI